MLNKNSGFTFIEVVAAVFVIALVITGVFTLIQRVTIDRAFAISQFQATYLVQEGIELVRNQRDENWLKGDTWNSIETADIATPVNLSNKTFTRSVVINDTVPDEITVTVTVEWTERGRTGAVTATSKLYNWIYW